MVGTHILLFIEPVEISVQNGPIGKIVSIWLNKMNRTTHLETKICQKLRKLFFTVNHVLFVFNTDLCHFVKKTSTRVFIFIVNA